MADNTETMKANGASFHRLSAETVPLTAILAQEFHDMEASPTERELLPSRVKHLEEKIRAGLAVHFNWVSAQLNGTRLRMNGNHSSNAILNIAMDGTLPEDLIVHRDHYQVDDTMGLALLFRQFDDRKSTRSLKDICGAYQGLFEDLRDIPRDTAKLAVEGVSWYRRYVFNPQGLPVLKGDDVGILFGEQPLHSFIRFLGELFTIKTPRRTALRSYRNMLTSKPRSRPGALPSARWLPISKRIR